MEKIHDELDEVKIEVEKLREECLVKAELSESLRKAHVEQLAKIQQSKLEMDELAQKLNANSVEICEIRQMHKELQSSLHKKDFYLLEISSTNEKLRTKYGEKILKLEGENRDLALALEEASSRIQDLESKTCASSEEIAGLKRLLSVEPERVVELHKNVSKDTKDRDEYILKMEEESKIVHDQLKWKDEQFSHLEEAHRKLQFQFQESKGEWQEEKSLLVDKISSLQANLDAQVQDIKNLETQLRMANEALAQEESKRKVLEVQLSECRSQFDDVFRECQVAKSERVQIGEKNKVFNQQLELKSTELHKVHAELKQRCDEIAVLMKQVESCDSLNQKDNLLEEEIRKHKIMLKESNELQCTLERQLLAEHIKSENAQNALEMVNFELANRTTEVEQSSLDLQKLKSEVESLRSDLEEIQAHDQEKTSLVATVNDKGVEIDKLQELISNLESTILEKSRTSKLICQEKDVLDEALKTKSLEIEDKKQIIANLEKEVSRLCEEGEFQRRSLIQSNQRVLQLEDSMQANNSEMQELKCQLEKDRSCFKDRLEEHEYCKQALLEDLMKASYDKDCLIRQLEGIRRQVEVFCKEDVKLWDRLGKMLHLSEGHSEPPKRNQPSSIDGLPSRKSIQVIAAERTPLTELNCIERV